MPTGWTSPSTSIPGRPAAIPLLSCGAAGREGSSCTRSTAGRLRPWRVRRRATPSRSPLRRAVTAEAEAGPAAAARVPPPGDGLARSGTRSGDPERAGERGGGVPSGRRAQGGAAGLGCPCHHGQRAPPLPPRLRLKRNPRHKRHETHKGPDRFGCPARVPGGRDLAHGALPLTRTKNPTIGRANRHDRRDVGRHRGAFSAAVQFSPIAFSVCWSKACSFSVVAANLSFWPTFDGVSGLTRAMISAGPTITSR